jgi:hypothetical protein
VYWIVTHHRRKQQQKLELRHCAAFTVELVKHTLEPDSITDRVFTVQMAGYSNVPRSRVAESALPEMCYLSVEVFEGDKYIALVHYIGLPNAKRGHTLWLHAIVLDANGQSKHYAAVRLLDLVLWQTEDGAKDCVLEPPPHA